MILSEMPCLKPKGLSIFTQTPEQRLLLGKDMFLGTHMSMTMRRFNGGHPTVIAEAELLTTIQQTDRTIGNRVIVLYGAAGSGKSHLMSSIEIQLRAADKRRPVIRIARNELDLLSIVNKFRHLLTGDYFSQATLQRWDEMRRKPRTLSKMLLLQSLERLVESDDVINTLFYRLIDLVEPALTQILERDTSNDALALIPHDAFDQMCSESDLVLPFRYEMLRQHLLDGFRELMLENFNVRDTLRQIADLFSQQGQRPVLLIDDMVQSITIFANEFLDYFISLDQGSWDVFVGITPASFQGDQYGRELLQRITHLDTFDDRVDKLWLSDEQGLESYFLNEENIASFAFQYLESFRHVNGVHCVACPLIQRCRTLQADDALLLAPFNTAAVIRLFRSLPHHKGKVRAFIAALQHILEAMVDGATAVQAFDQQLESDLAIDSGLPEIDHLLKIYLPGNATKQSAPILAFFDLPQPPIIRCTVVSKSPLLTGFSTANTTSHLEDPARIAVRDWLEGKPTNRQLLDPLRKGIQTWLRSIQHSIAPASFHRAAIAHPHKVLRDEWTELGTAPPICLEGIDSDSGILVERAIGHLAFSFVDLHKATGHTKKALFRTIAHDPHALSLIWAQQHLTTHRQNVLESQINMRLEHLVAGLFMTRMVFNGLPHTRLPGLNVALSSEIATLHNHTAYLCPPFPEKLASLFDNVFDDFFRIRDHVYDADGIAMAYKGDKVLEHVYALLAIPSQRIDAAFTLGGLPLSAVLEKVQHSVYGLRAIFDGPSPLPSFPLNQRERDILTQLHRRASVLFNTVTPDEWQTLLEKVPAVSHQLYVHISE